MPKNILNPKKSISGMFFPRIYFKFPKSKVKKQGKVKTLFLQVFLLYIII
jgi:hypothetical protein